jgi:4-hydroxybenzoate polyprenyltransferase
MLAIGLGLLFATASARLVAAPFELGSAGVATALCVVIYDRWHKGYAWSPLVMGACRGGLYILGALSSAPQLETAVLAGAGAIALYVFGLTHIARFETASSIGRVWPVALVFGPAALAIGLAGPPRTAFGALAGLVLWLGLMGWALFSIRLALRGGRQIGRAVVALIAGIALADAALMAAMGAFGAASFGVLAFGLTLLGQRVVRGT